MTLPGVGGYYPIQLGPEQNKSGQEEVIIWLLVSWDADHLLLSMFLVLRPSDSDQNPYHWRASLSSLQTMPLASPGSPACMWDVVRHFSFQNHMS